MSSPDEVIVTRCATAFVTDPPSITKAASFATSAALEIPSASCPKYRPASVRFS